jgi:class 3 adenylate cyclase
MWHGCATTIRTRWFGREEDAVKVASSLADESASLHAMDVDSAVGSQNDEPRSFLVERGEMSEASSRDIRTILFTDVEGSTALRTERGDDAAGEVLRAHETIVREQVARHGGREVKALGDGFMLAFASVRAALTCAVAIQRGLTRHNRDHPEQELRVRIGLNAGEVTEQGGDLFGEAVNAAARIAATAVGGEVLVSRVVKELAGTIPRLSFLDRGAVPLKGFPEGGHLYEVAWQEESEEDVLRIRLLGEVDVRYGGKRLSGLASPRLQVAARLPSRPPRRAPGPAATGLPVLA